MRGGFRKTMGLIMLPVLLAIAAPLRTAGAQSDTTAAPAAPEAPAAAPAPKPAPNPDKELERAFKKEFAFLEAQRQQLADRLEKFEKTSVSEKNALSKEVDELQDKLLAVGVKNDRLQDTLAEEERTAATNADNQDLLEATYDQAGTSLKKQGYALAASDEFKALNDESKIGKIFEAAGDVVRRLSELRKTPGTFYLADGTKTNGVMVKVGNIASYGISSGGAGALAPAGGGELKIWPKPAKEVAEALAADRTPDLLNIFLYESLDRAVSPNADKTILGVVESGGLIAWVIVVLGGIALLLILIRALFLRTASASTTNIIQSVGGYVREGKLEAALDECHRRSGSTGRVLAATIRNLDREREHLEDIISESILNERSQLNRFGAIILVLAAVAPLLGLLGTVTGMISTFDVITEFGTGDPKLLSGGISVALVTTELGLAVAIPTLLFGHLLSGWSDRIKSDMEKAALRVMNLYQEARTAA